MQIKVFLMAGYLSVVINEGLCPLKVWLVPAPLSDAISAGAGGHLVMATQTQVVFIYLLNIGKHDTELNFISKVS